VRATVAVVDRNEAAPRRAAKRIDLRAAIEALGRDAIAPFSGRRTTRQVKLHRRGPSE